MGDSAIIHKPKTLTLGGKGLNHRITSKGTLSIIKNINRIEPILWEDLSLARSLNSKDVYTLEMRRVVTKDILCFINIRTSSGYSVAEYHKTFVPFSFQLGDMFSYISMEYGKRVTYMITEVIYSILNTSYPYKVSVKSMSRGIKSHTKLFLLENFLNSKTIIFL